MRTADGCVVTLRRPRQRPLHEWGTIWRILGSYDGRPQLSALEAYAKRLISDTLPYNAVQPVALRVYAEQYATDPVQYNTLPHRRHLVHGPR
jgi:hypothetical protein